MRRLFHRSDQRLSLPSDLVFYFRPLTRPRIRRTFLGDIERRVATRETLRPSRSHTLGIISSANCSVICWKVLSPTDPCDQARSTAFTRPPRRTLALSVSRSSHVPSA